MRREHRQYTPITCIIGTGTQYIDTGYKFTNNANKHRIVMSYRKTGTSVNNMTHIFGSTTSSGTNWVNAYTDANGSYSSQCYIGATGRIVWIMDYTLGLFNIDFTIFNNTTILTINGVTTTPNYTSSIVSNANMLIFASSKGTGLSAGRSRMKLYYFQIYENDILIKDFIPVLDYNKVPCLYDKVNKVFHYNLGTGTFSYEV